MRSRPGGDKPKPFHGRQVESTATIFPDLFGAPGLCRSWPQATL